MTHARVNITLDVETHGARRKKELPLKLLVLGNFSHHKNHKPVTQRYPEHSLSDVTFTRRKSHVYENERFSTRKCHRPNPRLTKTYEHAKPSQRIKSQCAR
jgi:hypothetical protein